MKKKIGSTILTALLLMKSVEAYELRTHEELTSRAAARSVLRNEQGLLGDLGISSYSDKFPGTVEILSIQKLMEYGARAEDDSRRPLNHFYDPYYQRSLGVPGAVSSPDWILQSRWAAFGGIQEFSYEDALGYFRSALTASNKANRDFHWGRLFESLGHVIHHVQDMAQPQHVRNDPHYHRDWYIVGDPSLYENCTELAINRPLDGNACGTPLSVPEYPAVRLAKVRDFWTLRGNSSYGKGLADFTNANFVSKDTNFQIYAGETVYGAGDYPLPRPTTSRTFNLEDPDDLKELGDPRASEVCETLKSSPRGQSVNAKCEIEFVASDVYDAYTATFSVNKRASSISIFDQYLHLRMGPSTFRTDRLFTLNRFNYATAHPYLISRAIGYSAGLIDHFFRGRMEVKEAEVDGDKVHLKIKNVSAEGNGFGPGTFRLYYDAHDGTRKEAPLETGADLSGRLVVDGIYELTFTVPADLDVVAKRPFVVVFEGIIGEEEAVSGLVLDVPGLFSGISLVAAGGSERRLISFRDGQWILHPQQGFLAGNVDWKGQYRDGVPTRVLSWKGPSRYRDEEWGGIFNSVIYEGGRILAKAPDRVLGAAIQKDAEGKEWLIAVCKAYDKDVVYRRPATPAPDTSASVSPGWTQIAVIANPSDLHIGRRAWLFNGDGTEAQTMRELKRYSIDSNERKPLTRLKLTVHGSSVSMTDLGNEKIVDTYHRVEKDTCGSDAQYLRQSLVHSEGAALVAVDYVDDQEVFAKIAVAADRSRSSLVKPTRSCSESTLEGRDDVKWTLKLGSALEQTLYHEKVFYTELGYEACYATSESGHDFDSADIPVMDLRSVALVANTHHETQRGSGTAPRIAYDYIGRAYYAGEQAVTTSNYSDVFAGTDNFGRFGEATRNETRPLGAYKAPWSECEGKDSDTTWSSVSSAAVMLEKVPEITRSASATATAASDRQGNVAISGRVYDRVTNQYTYFNRLTHGDLGQVLGLTWPYYVVEARAQ